MKISDLIKREPERIVHGIDFVSGYDVPEMEEYMWEDGISDITEEHKRIEVHFYKDHCFDSIRVWVLSSVWFDGNPIFVSQCAGRGSGDHHKRFIVNIDQYHKMVEYVRNIWLSLPNRDEYLDRSDIVDIDDDIPGLTSFYGYGLDDIPPK